MQELVNLSAEQLIDQVRREQNQFSALQLPEMVVDVSGFANSDTEFNVIVAATLVAACNGVKVLLRGSQETNKIMCNFAVLDELKINTVKTANELITSLEKSGIAFFDESSSKQTNSQPYLNVLANPFGAAYRVLAVPNAELSQLTEIAKVVQMLGVQSAIVACAESGNAQFDTSEHTLLYQIETQTLKRRRTRSADFGLPENDRTLLNVANAPLGATAILNVLEGLGSEQNAPLTHARATYCATVINSAVIMLTVGKAVSFQHGAEMARDAIVAGDAKQYLLALKHSS